MPRIPEVPLPPADSLARELFAKQEEEYGFVLNTSRIYGHRPTIMRGLAQFQEGVDPEKLADLPNYAESPCYDARERAALELAGRMTLTHLEVEDAFFDTLKGMFTADELAAVAATENFRNKFNNVFRIAPQGFCAVPETLKAESGDG